MMRAMRSALARLMMAPMSSPRRSRRAWPAIASTMVIDLPTATTSDEAMQRCPAQPKHEATTFGGGHLGVGVGHHDEVVLGAAQAQRALAALRGAA